MDKSITLENYFNNEFYPNIINSIISAKEASDKIQEQEQDLKTYIYLKIQEQIRFINQPQFQGRLQTQLQTQLNILKQNLQGLSQPVLQGLSQPVLQGLSQPVLQTQLNQLRTQLQTNPKYIVDEQLKFKVQETDTNFIRYRKAKDMLIKTSYSIESKFEEVLTDLNNIRRNGCNLSITSISPVVGDEDLPEIVDED